MVGDPKRWLDPGAGGPSELVELLRHAERPEHLEAAALEQLVRRTQASLAASPPPVGPTLWLKGLLGLGVATLGVTAWMLASPGDVRDELPAARDETAAVHEADDSATEPVEDTARTIAPGSERVAEDAPPSEEEPPSSREATELQRPSVRASQEAYPEDTLAAEAASLESIRRAIDEGEAEDAIRQLRQHRRAFRLGQLVAERDRLEIEALVRAGRVGEARQRGAEFLRGHGGSVYASRVRALLEGMDP